MNTPKKAATPEPPEHYLSKRNGVFSDAIAYWDEVGRADVAWTYSEEIDSGEIDERKREALVVATTLRLLQREHEVNQGLQVHYIRRAGVEGHFARMGFETVAEWLDANGIDIKSGRGSQFLAIAEIIIPWLVQFRVIGDETTTNQWFLREVEGKSIISRTRNAVAKFKQLIIAPESEISLEAKIETARFWLSVIQDPKNTNADLRETFALGYTEDEKIRVPIKQRPDGRYEVNLVLTEQQLQYVRRRLAPVIEAEDVYDTDQMVGI